MAPGVTKNIWLTKGQHSLAVPLVLFFLENSAFICFRKRPCLASKMNTLRRLAVTGLAGSVAGAGLGTCWLVTSTSMIAPLPADDPLRKSGYLRKINTLDNPILADTCIKRLPLASVRPELQHDQTLLVTEFAKGVWAGWGKSFNSFRCLIEAS